MDFEKLKQRQKANSIESLTKSLEDASGNKKKDYSDDRIWSLKGDDAGNGYAIIRFLPTPDEDSLPFVKVLSHGWKNKAGRWFIENCPTTLGHKCPICEANGELWNTGLESNKDIARDRKKKTNFYSNILVIKDAANPENEGKVFLYRYGTKIFEKIKDAAAGNEEMGETPIDPFNMFEGANFKLKMRKVGGFPNYDQSVFDNVSAISDDENRLKEVFSACYSLKEFVDPNEFRSYDDLKQKFERFLSGQSTQTSTAESVNTQTEYKHKDVQADMEDTSLSFNMDDDSSDDENLEKFKSLLND